MPSVALLIPCYNAARYLPRLMETVRAQTRPFAGILCYDDDSTDNTVQVANELGLTIIVGQKNHGAAYARNRLLETACSQWIHFHDADDLLTPRFVERMSATLAASPGADVAVCSMDWNDEVTGKLHHAWRYDHERLTRDPLAETIRNPIGVIACVYRRQCLLDIGGFNETFRTWEDGDLHVRLAAAGARFAAIPDLLSIGLRHGRGASADLTAVDSDRLRLLERYAVDYPGCAAVAEEAERLAVRLFDYNRRDPRVERLLALCRRAGHTVPTTRHPIWRAARAILPVRTVLRLRTIARRLPL
jgi:glycosyltransferase involved in cell wall biosynthesis